MSVGLAFTKTDIDNAAASIAIDLRNDFERAKRFNALMNNTNIIPNTGSDAFLTGLGYQAGEITTLRSAFSDANTLYNIAYGGLTLLSVNNFFFNLQKLTGVTI